MRIAVDGSDLAAGRFEGPAVYAEELLPRLTAVLEGRGHEVVTYAPGALQGTSVAGAVRVVPGSPYWTQRILGPALLRDRPDVLFMPIQMLPVVRPRRMATVATVHDLEFLAYPETFTRMNRVLLRTFTRQAVRAATRLIAVSRYTRDAVVRVYGRAPDDIAVVHHGVNHDRFHPAEDRLLPPALPERFILFVGALQPRKNVEGLVAAFELVSPRFPGVGLVMVSGGRWKERNILARIERSPRRAALRLLRRLPHEDLSILYRAAEVLALPSLSEGFGMPLLEAMACGTPVVASNTSAIPEVVGDAALLVDPRDPPALARALDRMLSDRSLREDLRGKGSTRAAQFTWDRSAQQTADVIEEAARRKGRGGAGPPPRERPPSAFYGNTYYGKIRDGAPSW